MPRIRRWFHVSHDINSDPEVWELTDTFGDWFIRVWLQMLSIGDRNNFRIRGDRRWIEVGLSTLWKSNSKRYNHEWRRNRVSMALDWMVNKGWIKFESDGILICNQRKYNPSREAKEIPRGKSVASPPILSSPSFPSSPPSPPLVPPVGVEQNGLPDWLKDVLVKSEHFKALADGHAKFWRTMNTRFDQYEWLGWDEEIQKADVWCASNPNKAPTPRGTPKFLRNWFENAVEYGRKQRG